MSERKSDEDTAIDESMVAMRVPFQEFADGKLYRDTLAGFRALLVLQAPAYKLVMPSGAVIFDRVKFKADAAKQGVPLMVALLHH